ncbi:dynein regulatory complex subunit 5 [Ambystoma mexicanum]|uniref:dynein regulatory complex subunit 5 n=1 Tax=Ambystoma mexicanum TaxID=8296 RepID=UPI0037E8725F
MPEPTAPEPVVPDPAMPESNMSEPTVAMTASISPLAEPETLNPAADPRHMRRIIAEDPEWSLAIVPQLRELCIQHIINNFENKPILEELLPKDKLMVLEKLPTTMALKVTANLVSDEGYWKRCCLKKWEICDVSQYGGCWKRLYFERYLENLIERFIPDVTDIGPILEAIPLCQDYVKKLDLQQLLPPVKMNLKKDGEDDLSEAESDIGIELASIDHFDFGVIASSLQYLEELHLVYGVKGCGMNFEWHLFEFTSRDCYSLARALKMFKSLKVFRLHKSKVDDEMSRVLITSLLDHPSLTTLDFSYNHIGDRGARAVGRLINSSKLEHLNLCDNKIRAHGGQAIGHALSKNSTLISLNLRLNRIGDEGGQAICLALLQNTSLVNLHLGSNEMSEPTATVLSQVLSHNTVLRDINLSCNHIGLDGGKQLMEGMSDNKTVVEFDLRLTEVGQESEFCINQILRANQEGARLGSLAKMKSESSQVNL